MHADSSLNHDGHLRAARQAAAVCFIALVANHKDGQLSTRNDIWHAASVGQMPQLAV
jgi:hypothetical protein